MFIYKRSHDESSRTLCKLGDLSSNGKASNDLRVLACIHGPTNVPSFINLIESTRSNKKSSIKLFVMHLMELTERSSSIIMAQRARKNGLLFFNRSRHNEWLNQLATAFQGYSNLGQVSVQSTTAISSLSTMHEDICHVANGKRVAMIILPFHKQWREMEIEGEEMENNGVSKHQMIMESHGWKGVNQKVLKEAPCSVSMFVDRGYGNRPRSEIVTKQVCVMFFGGPDDREALQLGDRMCDHPTIKLTVMRRGVMCGAKWRISSHNCWERAVSIKYNGGSRGETSRGGIRPNWRYSNINT
ncbi:hypothetical protein SESBI_36767 [Sesbania bispinosa]|nr:hypothetical protein SESBI_36767 [Sesbania bispinosa]